MQAEIANLLIPFLAMPEGKTELTDLDKYLQELVKSNWSFFVKLVGDHAITSAKVCLLRSQKKSFQQISTKLKTTKSAVVWASKKCECNTSSWVEVEEQL